MTIEPWEQSDATAPLTDFRRAIMDLGDHVRKIADSDNENDVIDVLVLLHAIKAEIGFVFSEYQTLVTDKIPDSSMVRASNGQTIEKKIGNDRRSWEHEKLTSEVLRRLNEMSIDMDTGEVVMSSQQIALKLLDYLQPSYWRVKELAKLGINADQYCELGELKSSIIIRKVDK
jgi:hypothetical protein